MVAELATLIQQDPDAFIDERDRRRLAAFARRTYPGYQTASHIQILCDALERAISIPNSRLIVTMPPRHSKSVHVSENLPAYYLGKHPDRRVISASHTASLAYTFSRRVRNKIGNPKWPFPDVAVADDKGAVQAWDIEGDRGGYIAVGVGGSPTGHGADLIIIDDPVRSAADADSPVARDTLWEWYQGTLRTRLEPGGSIILTATRWHEDDLTGRLLHAESAGGEHWAHVHMPAIDDAGEALWPERWPVDALEDIKRSVGSRNFEAQYQGRPAPLEGGILKHFWFDSRYTAPETHYYSIIQAWDTAFKAGADNDNSACVTLGVGAHGLDVLDVYQDKLEFPDLERAQQTQHLIWSTRYPTASFVVLIEDKGSGQSLIQSARRLPHANMNIIPEPASRPNEKMQRVNEIAPAIEARRVRLPADAPWLDAALHEWTTFPFAPHDDATDAFAIAVRRAIGIGIANATVTEQSAFAPAATNRHDHLRRIRRLHS